ncbi:integrase [Mycobacterium tuberculosis]|uniref:integrase n=1 Tax=Mycobacterium tuberculosis TaxID=1773 RepID=UPI000A73803F|nr:integrase [Mycobacterium tuberculosis]
MTGKGIVESTTKTKRDRHVPVPEPVWRRLHAELPTDPNALVFPGRKGGFLPLGEYRWAFDNAGDQVGIEGWYRTVWDTPRPRWRSAQALTSRSCNRRIAPPATDEADDAVSRSLDTQQRR